MGWGRILRYWTFKLKRLQGSPYAIACGFACGASVSFTPLHRLPLHPRCRAGPWALRGNIIASAIGTAVGNPWTFPFIWAGIMWIGTWILGYERGQELPAELTFSAIFEQPGTVLLPMLVGGLPVGGWWCGSCSSSRSGGWWPTTSTTAKPGACADAARSRTRSARPNRMGRRRSRTTSPSPRPPPRPPRPVAANVTHLDQVMVGPRPLMACRKRCDRRRKTPFRASAVSAATPVASVAHDRRPRRRHRRHQATYCGHARPLRRALHPPRLYRRRTRPRRTAAPAGGDLRAPLRRQGSLREGALARGFRNGVFWRDMAVVNLPSGQPTIELSGGALKRLQSLTPSGMRVPDRR